MERMVLLLKEMLTLDHIHPQLLVAFSEIFLSFGVLQCYQNIYFVLFLTSCFCLVSFQSYLLFLLHFIPSSSFVALLCLNPMAPVHHSTCLLKETCLTVSGCYFHPFPSKAQALPYNVLSDLRQAHFYYSDFTKHPALDHFCLFHY